MRVNSTIRRLALSGVLAALYLALCYLDISFGRYKITLAATVIYFVSFCFGQADCFFVCFVGVFLDQLLYGLTPTTLLWMLPPLLRPILINPITYHYGKKGIHMEDKKILSISLIIVSSLLVSATNSLVFYLDSLIIGYPYKAVLLDNILQAIITMGTGVLEAFLLFPLVKAIRKANLLPPLTWMNKKERNDEK
ncbi:MAG: ECF transporter S component [Candidatus Enterosoma sp.]|nr:ECF transporter S component [Candidatus Enterosoma sp.]